MRSESEGSLSLNLTGGHLLRLTWIVGQHYDKPRMAPHIVALVSDLAEIALDHHEAWVAENPDD